MFFKKNQERLEKALENDGPLDSWERGLLEKVVTAHLAESRRARRWGVFFKLAALAYLVVLLWLFFPDQVAETVKTHEEHAALVEVKGIIAPETKASADKIVEGMRDAFKDKKTKEPAPELIPQVIDRCAANGLLVGAVGIFGNVIRVAPPLVITEAEAHESCDIMEKVVLGL